MEKPQIPVNDKERVEALESYSILDTLPEKEYDDITRLASEICGTQVSAISLIDTSRQWIKSSFGQQLTEYPRDYAFCAHAINRPDEIMIVEDARKDVRFYDNPFVTVDNPVSFYAGVPLTNPEGFTLGTLCIMDNQPRALNKDQSASLKALGNMVVKLFELRRKNIELEKNQEKLQVMNQELQQFAYVVSHDIRSPLNNIIALAGILRDEYGTRIDGSGAELIGQLNQSTVKLKDFIDGILSYYRSDTTRSQKKQNADLGILLRNIIDLLDIKNEFEFDYPASPLPVVINKTVVEQIFMNLITNAIKYNDKKKVKIAITFSESPEFYRFTVSDNGIGIARQDFEIIYTVFETLGKKDRNNNLGTGIGLSTVKKLVEGSGGALSLESEPGKGSAFTFTIKR